MSAESPRHLRSGGPLTVPSQPPSDRSIIDAVSGFINDVTLSSSSTVDPKDVIQWARFETADINEPTPEGDSDNDISPLLLILGYGSGVQVWLIPPSGEAQEVLSWRQGTVRVLRILPTPQQSDCFASKRPLIALCDNASPGPTFCSLSFISIKGGEQVKSIKFKNPILDVLANKRSVVVSFSERFAVFDAGTLEDRMAVTTCYPCPCPLGGSLPINPLALGDRWLAYADKKLNQSKRSSGGCEGEGVTSYTATVLHAAKSLSKGLRGLGETVAHSLSGGRSTSQSPSPPNADIQQPGVVTILDIEGNEEEDGQDSEEPFDPIVAHFVAHSEAIIALKFDASGMLLVTADRRGHDFHVFRVNPHPCGPSLASVHHLYILHRGDTTAKVQDIAISGDSRWAAISTLRGTTHVFAVSPYGGACGARTHTAARVVNRLSRFHRSAGLPIHAAAKRGEPAPVGDGITHGAWFPNPRLPPYPLPTTSVPLAQIRPTTNLPTHTITRTSSGRQRLSSLSEDSNSAPLLARARFAPAAGGLAPAGRAAPHAALYLMAASGELLHLALHPRPVSSLPKEKICDESPIELEVEPVAQWTLSRPPAAADLVAPLPPSNPLLRPVSCRRCADVCMSEEERWLSQVEIVTHAGPHRRLWMGPQFVFKTYNCTGSSSSLSEAETVEVDTSGVARSNPVNMPGARPLVPVLVDSGSASSLEHSPSDSFRRKSVLAESGRAASVCDVQLREDLAEAMKEDQGSRTERRAEPRSASSRVELAVELAVDPLGCVVRAPPPAPAPPPASDPDEHTRANSDEATFRPVARAPPAPPRADMLLRPLPRSTTIPVQPAPLRPAAAAAGAPPDPLPLTTAVVIPAALRPTPATPPPAVTRSPTPKSDIDPSSCKVSDRSSDIRVSPRREVPAEVPASETGVPEAPGFVGGMMETDAPAANSKDSDKKSSKISTSQTEVCADISLSRNLDPTEVKIALDVKKERKENNKVAAIASLKDNVRKSSKSRESPRRDESDVPLFKETEMVKIEAPRKLKKEGKEANKLTTDVVVKDNGKKSNDASSDVPIFKEEDTVETKAPRKLKKDGMEANKMAAGDVVNDNDKKCSEIRESPRRDNFADVAVIKEVETEETKAPRKLKKDIKEGNKTDPGTDNDKKSRKIRESPRRHEYEDVPIFKDLEPETQKKLKNDGREANKIAASVVVKDNDKKTCKNRDSPRRGDPMETPLLTVPEPEKVEVPKIMKEREVDITVVNKDNVKDKKSNIPRTSPRRDDLKDSPILKETEPQKAAETSKAAKKDKKESNNKDSEVVLEESTDVGITLKSSWKKDSETRAFREFEVEIKTEEQAWDMLLSEPERPILCVSSQAIVADKNTDEPKPKSKKNRKIKKTQDDPQSKSEDDSFVEIHAIEENQQISSGELVSISTPFEELESSGLCLSKTKKTRTSKIVSDKRDQCETKADIWVAEDFEITSFEPKTLKNIGKTSDIEILPEAGSKMLKQVKKDKNTAEGKDNADAIRRESTAIIVTESFKDKKSKSLSPYMESRKSIEKMYDTDVKDVYVIDSTKKEFPEIQITRGSKMRKKSPQPEKTCQEKEVVAAKPQIKSWSSIAASKNVKTVDDKIEKGEVNEKKTSIIEDKEKVVHINDDNEPSTTVSLQEKLIELCKRTDIMIAECDAPSELNFVEEHLSLQDLPPLEPLDFGLDDFNIEVMRDSLLEVNDTTVTSPICKINIDNILSSIKETRSSFNLIDLEKVPAVKEKGFSVVENDKITSQEVKLDDDVISEDKEREVMEKSSDDDIASPVLSADSDKEDKKCSGASSNATAPSSKQSKSKKSRRKKK